MKLKTEIFWVMTIGSENHCDIQNDGDFRKPEFNPAQFIWGPIDGA